MPQALASTADLGLKPSRAGKVRDVFDLGDRLLIVSTDRLSAYDVILPTRLPVTLRASRSARMGTRPMASRIRPMSLPMGASLPFDPMPAPSSPVIRMPTRISSCMTGRQGRRPASPSAQLVQKQMAALIIPRSQMMAALSPSIQMPPIW